MPPFVWAARGSEIVLLLDLVASAYLAHPSYGRTRTVVETIVEFFSLSSGSYATPMHRLTCLLAPEEWR